MTEPAPIERMQVIADYRTAVRHLVRSGKSGIVIGCLFIFMGAMNFKGQITDYLYLCLGTFELLAGLHNRYFPSALGIILDGILLILLGLWNLVSQFLVGGPGNGFSWFSTVFGALLILIAFKRFQRYPRMKAAFDDPPTEEQIAWFDDLIKEIHASKPETSDDIIQFTSGMQWKGKRFGGMAFFVDKIDFENLIVDPRDIEWTDKGKVLFGSNRHVSLRIGERHFKIADISPEMLRRLESWQMDGDELDDADAQPQ